MECGLKDYIQNKYNMKTLIIILLLASGCISTKSTTRPKCPSYNGQHLDYSNVVPEYNKKVNKK